MWRLPLRLLHPCLWPFLLLRPLLLVPWTWVRRRLLPSGKLVTKANFQKWKPPQPRLLGREYWIQLKIFSNIMSFLRHFFKEINWIYKILGFAALIFLILPWCALLILRSVKFDIILSTDSKFHPLVGISEYPLQTPRPEIPFSIPEVHRVQSTESLTQQCRYRSTRIMFCVWYPFWCLPCFHSG